MRSVNFSLGEYVSDIVSMDHTIDTCLLFARNLYTTKVAKIAPYSRSLEEGERVYNVAAPVGIFYKEVVPLLEGFFMGNRDTREYYSSQTYFYGKLALFYAIKYKLCNRNYKLIVKI